jgi:two-component system sensor histidine kinase CpxA
MKRRIPLYAKILIWFFLNLIILATVGYITLEGYLGTDWLLTTTVTDRLRAASEAILSELRSLPQAEWNRVLIHHSEVYAVRFVLFKEDGTQLAGELTKLPEEVLENLKRAPIDRRGPEHGPDGPPPHHDGQPPGDWKEPPHFDPPPFEPMRSPDERPARNTQSRATRPRMPPPAPRFIVRASSAPHYWIGMQPVAVSPHGDPPRFATLLLAADSLYRGGLFFDVRPALTTTGLMVLFSALFWFPFVSRIASSLAQLNSVTTRIAEGHFNVRVSTQRWDEIGQLGESVNRMAARLESLVHGQKRFLGDTAHELCTPLARIQVALGILEQRIAGDSEKYLADLREEVQHMTALVDELLSFSRASLLKSELELRPVKLKELIERAVKRESRSDARLAVEVPDELEALAEPDLLLRAIGNLVRNAIRYAGGFGPISISAAHEGSFVRIMVADQGKGVPEAVLQRLFDPFFRLDDARSRESGGVGLGLTIVKTCIESCRGTVECRNRQPQGLEVIIRLEPVSGT